MNKEHTPGPWRVESKPAIHDIVAEENGLKIYVGQATAQSWGAVGAETGEANAKLFAAAPDLLAALETILAQRTGNLQVTREEWTAATEAAQKALAKAKQ